MGSQDLFHGVACCFMHKDEDVNKEALAKLLGISSTSKHGNIACKNLEIKNKYYQTTLHLFDIDLVESGDKTDQFYNDCHAIILHGTGMNLTTELLDKRLAELTSLGGEPRLLICDDINEDCNPYKTLLDWSIKNGYELILSSSDNVKDQIIDSLSAYRWPHRRDMLEKTGKENGNKSSNSNCQDQHNLNEDTIKQLNEFETLLAKMKEYRDRPELRDDPNDKKIEEIAEILSNLLNGDVDGLLSDESA